MTNADIVDATLARAASALATRSVDDLALAAASLVGALDYAAKQERCEQLVRDVLRTVEAELTARRLG